MGRGIAKSAHCDGGVLYAWLLVVRFASAKRNMACYSRYYPNLFAVFSMVTFINVQSSINDDVSAFRITAGTTIEMCSWPDPVKLPRRGPDRRGAAA